MTRRTVATLSREEATVPAQRSEDATPVADLTKARLRTDYYMKRTAELKAKTINERAEFFKLHRATIVRIEQGHIEPSLGTAMDMAHRLGATMEALWVRRGEAA